MEPPKEKVAEAVRLREKGLLLREIAEELDTPLTTVWTWLNNAAREASGTELEPYGGPKPAHVEDISKFSHHPPHVIDAALLAYARQGNGRKASEFLAETMGVDVNPHTIGYWRRMYPYRFGWVARKNKEEFEDVVEAGLLQWAIRAQEMVLMAADRTEEKLAAGKVEEPWKVMQAASISGGIAVQRQGEMSGRPTIIRHEHREVEDIIRSINERAPGLVVEGQAEEIEEVEDGEG